MIDPVPEQVLAPVLHQVPEPGLDQVPETDPDPGAGLLTGPAVEDQVPGSVKNLVKNPGKKAERNQDSAPVTVSVAAQGTGLGPVRVTVLLKDLLTEPETGRRTD